MREYEENPFEDSLIAQEWINHVENERDGMRKKEIYPLIKKWVEKFKPQTVLEIGSGQGICCQQIATDIEYVGVEPSEILTKRAIELYGAKNRSFLVGNAYNLPIEDNYFDAVFSVNVWFHLEDLNKASKELYRALKPNGHFLIITANPEALDIWQSFYEHHEADNKKMVGKINIPVNPLTKNIIYKHSEKDIRQSLERSNLKIEGIKVFGETKQNPNIGIFIAIKGGKII